MTDKISSAFLHAEQNLRTGQELVEATAYVVQKRLEILAGAAGDPMRADHEEIGRMGAEKVEAFTASAAAVGDAAVALGQSCTDMAVRQSQQLQSNLDALVQPRDDAARLALQTEQIAQFWGQAMIDSIDLWNQGLKAQADIMAPVHATATANAERLKK